jgi:hypothetical protein
MRDCEAVKMVVMVEVASSDVGRNAARMLVLPGGIARFGWRGDG